jgi:DNA helicase-2/ATP-dependent DNA helicase PcrA
MVGMEEGLLPHVRALLEEKDIEEERRLCYVGITRAKEKLYFSYARSRFTYGMNSNSMPSRFLSEIDQKLLSVNRSFDFLNQKEQQSKYYFNQSKNHQLSITNNKQKARLIIDDESLEALLNDELDIREFLKK